MTDLRLAHPTSARGRLLKSQRYVSNLGCLELYRCGDIRCLTPGRPLRPGIFRKQRASRCMPKQRLMRSETDGTLMGLIRTVESAAKALWPLGHQHMHEAATELSSYLDF